MLYPSCLPRGAVLVTMPAADLLVRLAGADAAAGKGNRPEVTRGQVAVGSSALLEVVQPFWRES